MYTCAYLRLRFHLMKVKYTLVYRFAISDFVIHNSSVGAKNYLSNLMARLSLYYLQVTFINIITFRVTIADSVFVVRKEDYFG